MAIVRFQLVTPPAAEPVSLDEAKLHLRQDITDDDDLISALIGAARAVCETYTRKVFVTQTWDMLLDGFPFGGGYYNRVIRQQGPGPNWLPTYIGILEIPKPPLQAVVSLNYLDSGGHPQLADPAQYVVSAGTPGRIQPVWGSVWPLARPIVDSVRIRIRCGYGDAAAAVPPTIKAAIKLLLGHWYRNRESVTAGAMAELPMAVRTLLDTEVWGTYS